MRRLSVFVLLLLAGDPAPSLRPAAGTVALEALLDAGGLSVRGAAAIPLLVDRSTAVPIRLVNRTASAATLALDGSDADVGLHPFRVELPAGATADRHVRVTPLRTGDLDVEWRVTAGAAVRRIRQRLRVVPAGRLLVRISGASGRAAPALVRVTAADGRGYAPDGLPDGEFESDGLFELAVPAGDVEVSAARPGPPGAGARATAARRTVRVRVDPDRTVRIEVALP